MIGECVEQENWIERLTEMDVKKNFINWSFYIKKSTIISFLDWSLQFYIFNNQFQ